MELCTVGPTKFTVYRHRLFDFACMRAGCHYSDFKLVQSMRNASSNLRSPRPCTSIAALECYIVIVFNLNSESLKIHVGGYDKLQHQLAWPKEPYNF